MKRDYMKVAAALAFIIGAMAIFAGGQALMGKDQGYYVINWLLLYNYTIGILTAFNTAVFIWNGHKLALPAAIGTFSIHALVMLILQTSFRDVVAPDSIRAMTVRLVVWIIILGIMAFQLLRSKAPAASK